MKIERERLYVPQNQFRWSTDVGSNDDRRSQMESVARKVEDNGMVLRCVLKVKKYETKENSDWVSNFQNYLYRGVIRK